MHHSRLAQLIIDCNTEDLGGATEFWAAALGLEAEPLDDPQDRHYRQLRADGIGLNILLQQVAHPSRVHLDIESDDVEREVQRLERLGARRVEQVRAWWVMEAPTGHRFCVLRPQRAGLAEGGNRWD